MKKIIGQVTYEEKEQIMDMYEKKIALENLLLMDIKDTQERIMKDLQTINKEMQNWWNQMGEKYQWIGEKNAKWEIDFSSGEILLLKEKDD